MELWRHYFLPNSVDDALSALAQAPQPATIIAGGTDLLIDLESGRHAAVASLVDVSRIPEMLEIRLEGDQIWLGAAVPLARIVEHPLIQAGAQCLVEACSLIGGPQVRHVATLGGNVAHALPAGDGTIALLALEAEAQLASAGGRRWAPLESLFAGPREPAFDRGREVLVGFRFFPAVGRQASAFRRVMRPQGVAIAILNMAVWMSASEEGAVLDARLALGPAGPRPLRARRAEAELKDRRLEGETMERALQALSSEARLRTSRHRASSEYRAYLLGVLLKETLESAMRRSRSRSSKPFPPSGDPGADPRSLSSEASSMDHG